MAMSSDEEVRIKCLELSLASGGVKGAVTRARSYYDFVKGDLKRQPRPEPIPTHVTQEDMAKRTSPFIRPT